ncbi:MAG: hypothetical protein IPK18_07085 [Sphingobacteriales bacterium]|jgi:hypothetical protein|nr:MAG: hypothetical protein IPK18_07085 [Sphingobacteriales bacterium]
MKKLIYLLSIVILISGCKNNNTTNEEQNNEPTTVSTKIKNQTFTNIESRFRSYIKFEPQENDSTGIMTFSNTPTEVVYKYNVIGNVIYVSLDHIVRGNGVNLSQFTYTNSEYVGDYIYTYIGNNKYDFYNETTINTFAK